MFDVADIKTKNDLLDLVEADLGPPRKKSGRWYSYPCPFHQDSPDDGGSLRVTPDTQTWFCFGCHKSGDVIGWVRNRQNISFGEACQQLSNQSPIRFRPSTPASVTKRTPPDDKWQKAAEKILDRAQDDLWGPRGVIALKRLTQRGLTEQTIKHWGLGFNPSQYSVPEIQAFDGSQATVFAGIMIPARVDGLLWMLKIRQDKEPKYIQVAGGKPTLFGAHTLSKPTCLLVEGEFDAMLTWQEAGDLVGVASTTGGAGTWHSEWSIHLLTTQRVFVAYDRDETGFKAGKMVSAQIARAKQVLVPAGKDVTEYHQSGGSIRQWVIGLLPDEERPPKTGCRICCGTEWQNRNGQWICSVCN